MRQLVSFVDKINRRSITKEYNRMHFFAKLHNAEIKPLEEILGVSLDEDPFDPEIEKQLEKRAKKILAQKKAMRNV